MKKHTCTLALSRSLFSSCPRTVKILVCTSVDLSPLLAGVCVVLGGPACRYQLAGTFTLLSTLIALWHVTAHARHLWNPDVQRRVLAILWMVPVYGVTSWLSLVFPLFRSPLGTLRDCYEAYVVYTFFAFLCEVIRLEVTPDGKSTKSKSAISGFAKSPFVLRSCRPSLTPPPFSSVRLEAVGSSLGSLGQQHGGGSEAVEYSDFELVSVIEANAQRKVDTTGHLLRPPFYLPFGLGRYRIRK